MDCMDWGMSDKKEGDKGRNKGSEEMNIIESLGRLEEKVEGLMVWHVRLMEENEGLRRRNKELEGELKGLLREVEGFEKIKQEVRKKVEGLIDQLIEYDQRKGFQSEEKLRSLVHDEDIQESSIQFLPEEDM